MRPGIVISLFWIIFFSNSSLALKIHYVSVDGGSDKLPDRERFYLAQKGTLLLDTSLHDYKKWEARIGSIRKAGSGPRRQVSLEKVPELGFNLGDNIAFLSKESGIVESYQVKADVSLMLIPNDCSTEPFYDSLSLVVAKPSPKSFDSSFGSLFDSVAFRGNTYKLKSIKPTVANTIENKNLVGDLNILVKEFAHQFKIAASEVRIHELVSGEKKTFILSSSNKVQGSHFIKLSDGEYIRWDAPTPQNENDHKAVWLYGDFVEGTEQTLIYQHDNVLYVVLLTKDKVYRYPALTNFPFAGC